jgi:signal transduction histidine kinase
VKNGFNAPTPRPEIEPRSIAERNAFRRRYALLSWKATALMDRVVPGEFMADPERARRARLIARFGMLGSVFGSSYAAFYLLIGHYWGATLIVLCSFLVAVTPFVMRWKKSTELAGNYLVLTLTLGFGGLCFVEGGLHGHAIAWLVTVPLCALLLAGRRSAQWWAGISFFAASMVAGLDLGGIRLPVTYDPKWHSVVSAAGYMGLILFMFILGLVFESGRVQALEKMQAALAELGASNERLLHLNNEKNEFLGIAAHDLKNPLTVIVGSAELLKQANDPARIEKLTGIIVNAAKRMRDLINNLLDANAIEQGRFTSLREPCNMRALLEESVQHNQPAATKKNIVFRVGTSEGLWARADRAAILQILDNLISNALKYSPPNTTIHLHTLPEAECALVSVRDEGPGISQEDQRKLFQKFSRLSARPTGGESSTGLGLSIVKRLAEAMSGSIHCHSLPGSGATFTLRLPVWSGAPPETPDSVEMEARLPVAVLDPSPRIHARN